MPHRVLVVDCDRSASRVTAQSLAAAGYLSEVADSFADALVQIARRRPDLVVTPVRLGQFNGLHLVLRCRAEHPELPFVVTVDKRDAGLAQEVEAYGVRLVERAADAEKFVTLVGEILSPSAKT